MRIVKLHKEEIVITQIEEENAASTDSKQGTSKQALEEMNQVGDSAKTTPLTVKAGKFDSTNVCHFYATNKCKF